MDGTCYIDMSNWKIIDIVPGYIHCDKEIAEILAKLNMLGYKTIASCSGHNNSNGFYKYTTSIEFYDEFKNKKSLKNTSKVHIKDNELEVTQFYTQDRIYILFDKYYELPKISNGFIIEDTDYDGIMKTSISKVIPFYKDDDCSLIISDKEINEDLINSRKYLLEWVNKLNKENKKEGN